jgi:hypothetical protein
MQQSRQIASAELPNISVMTHHKCASSFVQFYLNEVCKLNGLRMFCSHLGTAAPEPGFEISLLTNAVYRQVTGSIDIRSIHVIRNPLDIVTSAYYSHRLTHSLDGWPQLAQQRRILEKSSKEAGIFITLAFLEQAEFYPSTPGPLHALRSWPLDDTPIGTIRMEDLVRDVSAVLGEILLESFGNTIKLPDRENFTFERIAGRHAGKIDETSHYRSGLPGGWRDELPEAVVAYVRESFRPLMERYYPDALE